MEKINTLEELRVYLAVAVARGLAEIMEKYTYTIRGSYVAEKAGWSALRIVLVGHETNGVRLCARSEKTEGEIEIILIRKYLTGPTAKDWDRILVKSAAWLEKRGLYPNRHVITDKTPSMFEPKP